MDTIERVNLFYIHLKLNTMAIELESFTHVHTIQSSFLDITIILL